jgi:hypothetical protein
MAEFIRERLNEVDTSKEKTFQDYYVMFRKARDFDLARFEEYVTLMAYYEGRQNFIGAYTKKPWVVDITTPYASDAIDLRVASLLSSDYIGELEPLSPDDVENVRTLNFAYQNSWKEIGMDKIISDSIYRASILREAYTHIVFDGTHIRGGTNRKKVGKLEAYFIDPASVLIDPLATSLKEADYVFITERISPNEVRSLYPDFDFDKARTSSSFTSTERGEIYVQTDFTSEQESVLMKLTCYEVENKGKKTQRVYKTVIVENQIVVNRNKLPINFLPIAQLRWEKRIKSPYGMSLLDRVLPLQRSTNAVESAIVNTTLSFAVPSYLVSTDSGVDPEDLAKISGAPGIVIPVEGGIDNAVRPLHNGKVVDEELMAVKQQMENTIYQMVGISKEFTGTFGTAGNTRGGAQEAANRAKMIEQKFFQNLEEYIVDLTEIIVSYIKEKYSGQTLYTRSPRQSDGGFRFEEYTLPPEAKDTEYTFSINLNVKTQYSKETTAVLTKELYQMERQYDAPVKVINIKDILHAYNIPNREELVTRYDELVKREDAKTAELITNFVALGAQYNIQPEAIQQGVIELIAGRETPTVDEIMLQIEETVKQQQQSEMMRQQQGISGDETYDTGAVATPPEPGQEGTMAQPPMEEEMGEEIGEEMFQSQPLA